MERMEESAEMACSQWVRGLIYHETGTAADLDAAIMEESVTMSHSQTAMH